MEQGIAFWGPPCGVEKLAALRRKVHEFICERRYNLGRMRDTRRSFLKTAAVVTGANAFAAPARSRIEVVSEIQDAPVVWAVDELRRTMGETTKPDRYIVTRRGDGPAEAFRIRRGQHLGKDAIEVTAGDARGFVYGLLEMADRFRFGSELGANVAEAPANRVRSISRAFVSDVEDKGWFYDKNFWREYLSMLASQRFNRFALTLGLGYDFPRGVVGDYLHFAYPYLVQVPGYDVRVVPLAEGERERNLAALQFISEETALRGMQFQLGLWTHAYAWTDSPNAQHHIEGLTPETHGPYCRDAMALLLKSCPAISGVTMRVHGESGIPEGSHAFWQNVFDGIVKSGRQINIDLHAKGLDPVQLEMAFRTGMPVSISPKYWAEHMGLGYQQASIRDLEMPRPDKEVKGTFAISEGSRRFLRYGYGDLFQQGRQYEVLFRMWPGTERLLLWGDPAAAAAYGRASSFQGAAGVELCEPLFFKGRQGSGIAGGRCAYLDETLKPRYDFEKYLYTYRLWGRLLYNPDADPESWRRYLRSEFGEAAASLETACANGSRVLPLFTTARLPSASNLGCWPEMYSNMPIVEHGAAVPYGDTVVPKRLGTVSPLDPQLFSTIEEHAVELLSEQKSGKYSPLEVAEWLEGMTQRASQAMEAAGKNVGHRSAAFRRMEEDVWIQIGLGRFFAGQIRSAMLFELYLQTGDAAAKQQAIKAYEGARNAWAEMARRAKTVYQADVTFGETAVRRGHWLDRLPAIDLDLNAMRASSQEGSKDASQAIDLALGHANRLAIHCEHVPVKLFSAGQDIGLTCVSPAGSVKLFYRHVDQAERWEQALFAGRQASIPAAYTKTAFAIQYYFELRDADGNVSLFPGFGPELANQPYFVISQERA
jgi:hypothetical protein